MVPLPLTYLRVLFEWPERCNDKCLDLCRTWTRSTVLLDGKVLYGSFIQYARIIFQKTNSSYPLIRTPPDTQTYVFVSGGKKYLFFGKFS